MIGAKKSRPKRVIPSLKEDRKIMGKKLGQESSKITKNEEKQFKNWIKVVRPKVYITDSTSFKRLVQELTGNGKTISSPSPVENFTVEEPESSTETCFEFGNHLIPFPEESNQYNQLVCFDDTNSDELLRINQLQEDEYGCQDLESLLLDIDQYPLFNECYSQIYQEEVSIYDYEISGLLA